VPQFQGLELGSTQFGVSIRKFFALTLGCDFGLVGLVVVFMAGGDVGTDFFVSLFSFDAALAWAQ